jgi:pimeloyl-ACP methyl ester carboxylesterase
MALFAETRGTGRQILCLAPFGVDRSMMAAALEPVFGGCAGWQRIYLDLPGCGRSPDGPADSDGIVEAITEFMDQRLGARPAMIVGWSYGGYLATALLRRAPDRFAGALLICHGVKINHAERRLPAATTEPEPTGWLDRVPEHLTEHLATALGNRRRDIAERVAAALIAADNADQEYLDRLRANGYRLSDEGAPAVYQGTTCVVTGRHDRIAGYHDQFEAMEAFPNGSFTVLANAGHYVPFEQPAVFRALAREWLSRCDIDTNTARLTPERRRWPA